MGYLAVENVTLENFNKAVISLWFRVPQASIDACVAAYDSDPDADTTLPFNGIIPLVNFGEVLPAYTVKQEAVTATGSGFTWNEYSSGSRPSWTPSIFRTTTMADGGRLSFVEDQEFSLPGSYIGVDVRAIARGGTDAPVLFVVLQTAAFPHIEGLTFEQTAVANGTLSTVTQPGLVDGEDPGASYTAHANPDPFPNPVVYTLTGLDWATSETWEDVSEFVNELSSPESFGGTTNIPLAADKWHHLLLSFDLDGSVTAMGDPTTPTISSSCSLWCAVDDVNYSGIDLPGTFYFATPTGMGDNNIITRRAFETYQAVDNLPESGSYASFIGSGWAYQVHTVIAPSTEASYSFGPGMLETNGKAFGFPAEASFADNIYKVELAEFQLYTGVTLDTAIEDNRRAFVGADGKPVPTKLSRNEDGDVEAADDSAPVTLLGKLPEIAFVKSSGNWIHGIDLGTVDNTFAKTGTIKTFKPDPKLGPVTPP